MKKIKYLCLLFICFFPCIVLANNVEIKYTKSKCSYSKEECSNINNCIYIDEYNCGVLDIHDYTYSCEYYGSYEGVNTAITGYFEDGRLQSISLITDEISTFTITPFVHSDEVRGYYKMSEYDKDILYYECPTSLWYDSSKAYVESDESGQFDRIYRPFSTESLNGSKIKFDLKTEANFNGIMGFANLPEKYEEQYKGSDSNENLEPKTCKYDLTINNYVRKISITYHNKTSVTAEYEGAIENWQNNKIDVEYIKSSEYFENWECPPEGKVYAKMGKDEVLYISYDKSDLGDDDIFEFEGDDSNNNSDTNLGEEQYGCDVVPEVVRKWIKIVLNFVKYVALVLVIVLGTIDFIKASAQGDPDSMKKAGQAFLKRVVAVILLFLLPMLVEFILNLINLYGSTGDCFGIYE